jgi:alpha-ketoglutarate-dependent taurine dioxygenase
VWQTARREPRAAATRESGEAMAFERIQVRRLAGSLGAEISGVDLSQPLDDPTQNRCTQHRVVRDRIEAPRRTERVTLLGDALF